jgi:hypothetical protein
MWSQRANAQSGARTDTKQIVGVVNRGMTHLTNEQIDHFLLCASALATVHLKL